MHGWPETKASISCSAQVYWDVRGELSELKGIILKGERILVPSFMRKENNSSRPHGHREIQATGAGPTILRGTQRQFLENICSEDDLRSRIVGPLVVKFLACLPLLGFSNI